MIKIEFKKKSELSRSEVEDDFIAPSLKSKTTDDYLNELRLRSYYIAEKDGFKKSKEHYWEMAQFESGLHNIGKFSKEYNDFISLVKPLIRRVY